MFGGNVQRTLQASKTTPKREKERGGDREREREHKTDLSCMAREISRVSALALDERRLEDTVAHAVRSVSIVKPRASVDSSVHFARFDSVMTTSRPYHCACVCVFLCSGDEESKSHSHPAMPTRTHFFISPQFASQTLLP